VTGAAERVRVAMIGAGRMANNVHYPSLASFDDVEIAAICDLAEGPLNATADAYGVQRRYTDYRAMVEEVAPQGVYAIGQPHLMYDVWLWCLRRGLPLYIEKPMGLTWHQARMLAHVAEEQGVITQVSHQRRTSPLLVALRQEVLARGPVVHGVCEFYKHGPSPMLGPRDHMMDDCVHAIDTLRWICGGGQGSHSGADVAGIESRCRRIGTPDVNWITATLHFANGATGIVLNSCHTPSETWSWSSLQPPGRRRQTPVQRVREAKGAPSLSPLHHTRSKNQPRSWRTRACRARDSRRLRENVDPTRCTSARTAAALRKTSPSPDPTLSTGPRSPASASVA
jgi:predicted dehydrogenase